MLTAIIVDEAQADGAMAAAIDAARNTAGIGEVIAISSTAPNAQQEGVRYIVEESLMDALQNAIRSAPTKRLLVLSSMTDISGRSFGDAVVQIDSGSLTSLAIVASNSEQVQEWSTPASIRKMVSQQMAAPFFGLLSSRSILSFRFEQAPSSLTEYFVQVLIRAITDGESIDSNIIEVRSQNSEMSDRLAQMEDAQSSRLLQALIDQSNIEELFPELPWSQFSQEAAAAAYHALAGLFLRMGDTDSASQALSCSQQLEDSPRYFALKGLIAQNRGETLGAVANMVSSLQCYEARKQDTGEHLLTFRPTDFEVINTKLVAGLQALNQRDNDAAFAQFSEAVFCFDPFYQSLGITKR
jgi:hypothetical protein